MIYRPVRQLRAAAAVLAVAVSLLAGAGPGSAATTLAPGSAPQLATGSAPATGPIVGIAAKCLDDYHSGTANGTGIDLYSCNGSAAQSWSLPGDGTIRVLGKCLDDDHSGTANGTRIQLYACNGGAAQHWSLPGDGTIRIFGKCLDDYHSGTANGTAIQLYACNGGLAQRWRTPGGGGPRPTTKVLTIVLENHSLAQMQAGMPYLNSLADSYGYATDYRAVAHPSLPNYLAIAFGTTAGITDDGPPGTHHVSGDSVFSLAQKAGTGARLYEQSMTSSCQTANGYPYAVKHNPWAYGSSGCSTGDLPAGSPQAGSLRTDAVDGTLPCAGMMVPDLLHDAHDGSLATADAYLKSWLPGLMSGPDFTGGRLAIVVTADEDDSSSSANRVLTVVISPSIWHKVATTTLTHYSLSRMYGTVCHEGSYLGSAATAPSMLAAFGLVAS